MRLQTFVPWPSALKGADVLGANRNFTVDKIAEDRYEMFDPARRIKHI